MQRIVKRVLSIQHSHLWLILIGIILLLAAAAIFWLNNAFSPSDAATRAFVSDAEVTTGFSDYYTFTPTKSQSQTAILIYPGGKIQPLAYTTLARKLAEAGHFVVIVPMPFNLAILDPNKGTSVMNDFPSIPNWIVVGHSLGGVAATKLASADTRITGIAMLASVADPSVNLSTSGVRVTSIIGTKDGLISVAEIEEGLDKLPDTTKLVKLDGGNHSYFGDYGLQPDDGAATISWEEQQFVTVQEILELAEQAD